MLVGGYTKYDNLVIGIDRCAALVQISGHVKLEDLAL